MIEFPFCKINLGLHILRKREDGYHDIETCFYPVPWRDILEIIPSNINRFEATGLTIPGKPEDNIVVKAYNLLKKDFNLRPVQIHLHKIIPNGAGLGGGSSDGSHALKLLNMIFDLGLSTEKFNQYALTLGSDCPFFIQKGPMLASGRGEILKSISIDLKGLTLVIVKPPISVSTAEAYSNIQPNSNYQALITVLAQPLSSWKTLLRNDFEDSVFEKHPTISQIKNTLYQLGAAYASMSGSGSSVFALFEKNISLDNHFKGLIVWQTTL